MVARTISLVVPVHIGFAGAIAGSPRGGFEFNLSVTL
jgi:hypothetical protein